MEASMRKCLSSIVGSPPEDGLRGDYKAFGDGIVSLLGDTERRHAMGRAAQQWAQTHDAHWTAEQFEKLYRSLKKLSTD